jgi:hypothetical protein
MCKTFKALSRPRFPKVVDLWYSRHTRRDHNPGLLCRGIDMDTRRELVRLIERADSDKADHLTCLVVVAPQCNPTLGAAGNFLAFATVGGRVNNLDVSLEQLYAIGLHECVKGEGGSGFSLAPATVTTVDNQWPCDTAITHEAAGTAAVEW